jgi:signal peptidase I
LQAVIEKPIANETALWKAILHNQKQAWFKMHSGSMSPLMPTGADIFVKYLEHKKIRAGDIVLYIDGNQLVAHRVLKVNTAKNQCLQGGDNAVTTSVISIDNIIGVVEKIKNNEKEFDISSHVGLSLVITVSSLIITYVRQFWPKAGHLLHRVKIRLLHKMVKYLL